MAEERSYKISFNAAGPTEQDLGEEIRVYTIYCETEVMFVQEDGDASKITSYRVPAGFVAEQSIPCRTISVIGESGSGDAYIKAIPQQSNQAIPYAEVYEDRAVNPAMR